MNIRMKWAALALASTMAASLAGCSAGTSASNPYGLDEFVMVMIPGEDTEKSVQLRDNMADAMSEALGVKVTTYRATDYSAAVEAMRTGNAQLAYLGPFSYITATERAGAEAVAVQGVKGTDGGYQSYIVVSADSDIETLADLQGKTFAFVDPESASGNVVPCNEILNAVPELGLTFDDLHTDGKFFKSAMFAGSHAGSMQAVIQGNVDAAAVSSSTYENQIEEGLVTESTQFYCGGSYQVADRNISCWKTAGHGTETFAQGLCNSCNPVFMQLSEMLGANTFYRYFEAFGMTQKTKIDLIGESNSIYYNAEGLGPTELATSSFGQSFRVTPIQMITAAAAVANGGYLVQPHVVSKVIDQEGNIVETIDTSVKRQVISEETSARVSAILQEAATTGSAKNGYVAGYRVAGKTGTSEKIDEWNAEGREGEKKYIASYCGYAPAEDPEIIMLVFFDEPLPQNGQVFGSAIAGPPFAETMAEILPYLGIEPKYTEEELSKLDISTPGVVGLTKEDAQVKISNASLTYKVYGEGEKVVSQIPEQGKSIPKGGTVVLYTDEASTSQTVAVPQLTGLSLSQVNSRAAEAGLNISVSGAALASGNAVSESQDIAEGTQVPPGTVVTVNFVDLEDVH